MTESHELAACYQLLQLRADASVADVDAAYFRLKAQKIQTGERQDIAPIKRARTTIKTHLAALAQTEETPPSPIESVSTAPPIEPSLEALVAVMADQGFTVKVSSREQVLNLGITLERPLSPSQVTAHIQQILAEVNRDACGLTEIKTVCIYGLDQDHKAQWKKSLPLPAPQTTTDDVDLYSFNNRVSNTLLFPGLLLMAALLNGVEAIKLLLFGVHIWIHEFGHATVAWLGGYRATPLPFGWTNIGESRSLFVYIGVLTLLALLFWAGKKEQSHWSMGLAVGLAITQFWMTWLISEETFSMLVSFGGIGGEFYLSTLLIVSFYFPLPAYWRWDFFRYPAVLFAGFTFLGSFWHWRQIERGLEAIPWGSLFGGAEHIGGDMNQLSIVYGWSDQRIIDTYNSLGSICAIAIVSMYLYVLLKNKNYQFVHSLISKTILKMNRTNIVNG